MLLCLLGLLGNGGSAWSNVFPIADSPRDSFEPNTILWACHNHYRNLLAKGVGIELGYCEWLLMWFWPLL